MSNTHESLVISGKAYWAKIKEGQQDEKGVFSMDVTVDKDTKAKLKALKVEIKNKDVKDADFNRENPDKFQRPMRGDFVTVKSRFPAKVVNASKEDINDTIGNGSEVNVI